MLKGLVCFFDELFQLAGCHCAQFKILHEADVSSLASFPDCVLNGLYKTAATDVFFCFCSSASVCCICTEGFY